MWEKNWLLEVERRRAEHKETKQKGCGIFISEIAYLWIWKNLMIVMLHWSQVLIFFESSLYNSHIHSEHKVQGWKWQ